MNDKMQSERDRRAYLEAVILPGKGESIAECVWRVALAYAWSAATIPATDVRDAARLDWLAQQDGVHLDFRPENCQITTGPPYREYPSANNVRDALDAARAASQDGGDHD